MKRIQLVEWGMITIALIFGYKFFETIFYLVIQIVYSIDTLTNIEESLIKVLVVSGLYAAVFIILIRNSSSIARWIVKAQNDVALPINIGKRAMLQVVLIGLCINTILTNITKVLIYIFESFKEGVSGNTNYGAETQYVISKTLFQAAAAELIVALIALFLSKHIVNWFIRKNEPDELVFDSEPESGQNVH